MPVLAALRLTDTHNENYDDFKRRMGGDPGYPSHNDYLLELGRATYAAAGLAGIAFDVLRIHGGVDSAELYSDPLGTLQGRLKNNPLRSTELTDSWFFWMKHGRCATIWRTAFP